MTDLNRLAVSLTKHGAHKVAALLERVEVEKVIQSTWQTVAAININAAQAKKTLSTSDDGILPNFWLAAKEAGSNAIRGLVLLGIVFSHWRLIEAMSKGCTGYGVGAIKKDEVIGGKAFSNFKDDFRELGFIAVEGTEQFSFDIRRLLQDQEFGPLAMLLFQAKLSDAGWARDSDPIDECLRVGFHRPLGVSEIEFRSWTAGTGLNLDELAEAIDPDDVAISTFVFKAGHRARKIGEIERRGHGESAIARLVHNELQSKLFNHLVSIHGLMNVGTENAGGMRSAVVDLVVKTSEGLSFYEIKTSNSLRKSLREAISQLLEYAYWPEADRARELIIVSPNRPTRDARKYLNFLRKTFSLPIFHETINGHSGRTSERI